MATISPASAPKPDPTQAASSQPDAASGDPATGDAVASQTTPKKGKGRKAAVALARYIVLHSGVGPWLKGEVITEAELTENAIDRLLGIGAIGPHQDDEAEEE